MTTVEEIRCHRVRVPLHTPFVTNLRRATHAESLLVEVVDSDGRSGWGEAPQVWQVTGESLAGGAAAVDGPLAAAVVGADPGDLIGLTDALDRAIVGNHSAKGAVDVALHDLAATTAGLPLARYLGGAARSDVRGHRRDAVRRVGRGGGRRRRGQGGGGLHPAEGQGRYGRPRRRRPGQGDPGGRRAGRRNPVGREPGLDSQGSGRHHDSHRGRRPRRGTCRAARRSPRPRRGWRS